MSDIDDLSDLTPADADAYRAVIAAFSQTGRGRWFLAEFARRSRRARSPADPQPAPEPLDAILADARAASAAVLDCAEQIQEAAWTFRERGIESQCCDRLDQRAADIYAACARHDAALERLDGFHGRLRAPSDRLTPVRGRESAATQALRREITVTMPPGAVTTSGDTRPEPPSEREQLTERRLQRLAVLAEIDAIDLHEKLRLFT